MNSTLGNRHGSAVITVPSDTEILSTRQFDAWCRPRASRACRATRPARANRPSTLTLDESGGVTTMTLLIQVPSQETRDAILASGMKHGLQISYNRLEDLVRQAG